MLSGLILWAAQFFSAYIIGSVLPGTELARWLVGLLTIAFLGAAGLLLVKEIGQGRAEDDVDTWTSGIAAMGLVLAIVAIAYQGLPALLA